ncbi:Uncharacterised protein [Amycolatopsis camponoti]|uniref:Uncharacterized protein n=1 Tax=Amycolatopsis camponoti TaxID=2606593 RepID=A0A6I8LDY1_9PSEU|nr:Uncharacterised protein [Amycolatopsis camponoti]
MPGRRQAGPDTAARGGGGSRSWFRPLLCLATKYAWSRQGGQLSGGHFFSTRIKGGWVTGGGPWRGGLGVVPGQWCTVVDRLWRGLAPPAPRSPHCDYGRRHRVKAGKMP